MKKLISLLLCLTMLTGAVLLFASCNREEKTVDVDLSQYDLVRGKEIAASLLNKRCAEFCTALKTATGLSKRFTDDKELNSVTTTDKELLLGNTKRAETKAALKKIEGNGYIIEVTEHKIVIVGTTQYLTFVALAEFQRTYLNDADGAGTTFTMKETALHSDIAMLALNEGDQFKYTFVYDDYIDDEGLTNVPEYHGASNADTNPDQVDYAVHCCYRIADFLKTELKLKSKSFNYITDADEAAEREIQIGILSREGAKANLNTLKLNEYGLFIDDKNIMLVSWSESTLDEAYDMFRLILEASIVENADGSKSCYLPANVTDVHTSDEPVYLDFPAPEAENLTLLEYVDVHDDSYEYIYTGDGATAANYIAYCQSLEAKGYVLNNEDTIENSMFRTYYSAADNKVIHATFAAFKYGEVYHGMQSIFKNKPRGHCPYPDWPVSIRLVVSPYNDGDSKYLMDDVLLNSNQKYTKVTDSMITSINQKGYNSTNTSATGSATGYVITLEDGTFFVCDGGSTGGGIEIYDLLSKLFYRIHGEMPSKENPIVISGYYLTHLHGDHTGKMKTFTQRYGSSGLVDIKYFFVNMASMDEQFNICGDIAPASYQALIGDFANTAKVVKVHSGYRFYLANVEFEVLYTHEDMHPFMLDYFNETSVVIRAFLKNSEAADSVKPTSFLMTGDMNRFTGWYLCGMFGDYLKSDQMNVAHHGWAGPYEIFYEAVDPIVLWWPNGVNTVKKMMNGDAQGDWYQSHVDEYIARSLQSVRYIFVSDRESQTLVITEKGPDYKNLLADMFNAETGYELMLDGEINIYFSNRDK